VNDSRKMNEIRYR